ncbi:MAG: PAS domain S-box protein [candidate division Zixibacteria bacterium]|nr:PAS domain S-box protein [candidate division Zixibacteria bacterium]
MDDPIFENLYQFIIILILAVAFSAGFAWIFTKLFISPSLNRLINGMNELADKKFDYRLGEDDKDEFGSLSASFNDMASMLSSYMIELKKNRDYLQSILESSADIIITVNASGKIIMINTGAEMALGYKRFEITGKPIELLFADSKERDEAIEKLKYADSVVNYETQFKTKDGEIRDVLVTMSRLRNPAGAIIGTIGISKDITEEKRLQTQLIQSQRYAAIGQVFTGIQHSMKNMLNALKGGAYMVKVGLAKDKKKMLEEGWEIVQEGINGLTDMSMDMLRYVKEYKPKLDQVDLTEALSEIYRILTKTAESKGIILDLNISPELPKVMCDARMIHSVIMDIVSNALDACVWKNYDNNEKPRVSMSVNPTDDNDQFIIEIKDNGCGMTNEVKANIFTPFFSTKSRAGTGLGLSISARMIGVHGGKIEVESKLNQGSLFKIILPLSGPDKNKEKSNAKKSYGS